MSDEIERLLAVMSQLRHPTEGCPWDVEQTFQTIAPYTIEEAHEVADAIDRNDFADLKDELGDLLLQVVFHAQMARESQLFDFRDVVIGITEKMIRRHPHVFGDGQASSPDEVIDTWEQIKSDERAARSNNRSDNSALGGISTGLPSLIRALKLQKRAAAHGFDWPDARMALAKFEEETRELEAELDSGADRGRILDELGDILFTCVNVCRKLDIDPETALRRGNAKFERRFRHVERIAGTDGTQSLSSASLEELDRLWSQAKSEDLPADTPAIAD